MKPAAYRLSKQCAPDLDGIADYLIAQNERAAKRVVAALLDAFEILGQNPEAGERRD
jgi:plasmid stabilization system protein ParE